MKRQIPKTVPEKTKTILIALLVVFSLIGLRVWSLAIIFHDKKVAEARRPQKRCVIEKAERASITDRHGEILATNRVQYNGGVCYGPIKQIPRIRTIRNEKGKKVKTYPRKDYVVELSRLLAQEFDLDENRVEDLIYSEAAILGNAPYILKEDIGEEAYFRLKIMEKDWPGLLCEVGAKRVYPKGAMAAESIGYIGPISRAKYNAVMEEISVLKEALAEDPEHEEIKHRLQELERLSYSFNDYIGKVGVEATFDEELRGRSGKRLFLTDIKGNFLHELEESTPPTPGQQIRLSLSTPLQEYAESLLAQYSDEMPSQRPSAVAKRKLMPSNRPWLKEGAIVVMDPKNGELLALASFPRCNPEDFLPSTKEEGKEEKEWQVRRWLESEDYLGGVWDQKTTLVKEHFDLMRGEFYDEHYTLDWPLYLSMILPDQSPVYAKIQNYDTIKDATTIQLAFDRLVEVFDPLSPSCITDLLYQSSSHTKVGAFITLQDRDLFDQLLEEHREEVEEALSFLSPYFDTIPNNHDKLLLLDLYRLALDPSLMTPDLLHQCRNLTLGEYKELTSEFAKVISALEGIVKQLFHDHDFFQWRESSFKSFLAKKRKEEKLARKRFAKPYLEYLDKEEKRQFALFWEQNKMELLLTFLQGAATEPSLEPYAKSLSIWREELLTGAHHALSWTSAYLSLARLGNHLTEELLVSFRPFQELNRPLYGLYSQLRCDEETGVRNESHLAMGFYPRYGHGYLRSHAFRQAATLGSIFKLVPAYAALIQLYDSGARGLLNPLTIIDDRHKISNKPGAWNVGFFTDGRPIPIYYHGGRLPKTDHSGAGRVDVPRALEVSSNPYFAMLAGDLLQDPEDLCDAAKLFGFGEKTGIDLVGEYRGKIPEDVVYNKTGLYSMAIGQHTLLTTPLQTAVMMSSLVNGGRILKPKIVVDEPTVCRWQLHLPDDVQRPLLEGMQRVMIGEKGTGRFMRHQFPNALIHQMIGKTSTAEVIENYGCDTLSKHVKSKSIWFGSILFSPEDDGQLKDPELVIIVYLKDGEYGRFAMPYALKMAQKYRELKGAWH